MVDIMEPFEKILILCVSQKGGVGKSSFASALLGALRRGARPIAGYDGDGGIGSLSDMYALRDEDGLILHAQDPLTGVVTYDIRNETRDTLVNSLDSAAAHVLHDLAGGALVELQRLFGDRNSLENLFRVLQSVRGCVVFCHLLTPDRATVESVAIHLDLVDALGPLGHCARHVAVLNRQGNRDDAAFPDWFGYVDATGAQHGGKTRNRLLAAGGVEMDLPALDDRLMARAKQLHMPFSDACADRRLTLIEQQRARIFTEDFERALTPQVRLVMGIA